MQENITYGRRHGYPGKTHHLRSNARNEARPMEGRASSFFDVGTDVLDIRPLSVKIRPKRNRFVTRGMNDATAKRLMKQAGNYAGIKGFSLAKKKYNLNSNDGMLELIDELTKKGKEKISLIRKEDGSLSLSCIGIAGKETQLYFIPIAGTYHLEEKKGLLLRRFLKAFCNRFKIDTVTNGRYYDCIINSFEDELEYQEALYKKTGKEDDKPESVFDAGMLEMYKDYSEGEKGERLAAYEDLKPLREDDLKAFRPESEQESKLLELMQKGFDIMKSKTNIWDYNELSRASADEFEEKTSNGCIEFQDLLLVTYNLEDNLTEEITRIINEEYDCGSYVEEMTCGGEIPEEGPITEGYDIPKIIDYIDELSYVFHNLKHQSVNNAGESAA